MLQPAGRPAGGKRLATVRHVRGVADRPWKQTKKALSASQVTLSAPQT